MTKLYVNDEINLFDGTVRMVQTNWTILKKKNFLSSVISGTGIIIPDPILRKNSVSDRIRIYNTVFAR